jgi:hypothetical protein
MGLEDRAKEVLTQVKDYLENPVNWTRDCMARDAQGQPVDPTDPRAVSFCGAGLFGRVFKILKEQYPKRDVTTLMILINGLVNFHAQKLGIEAGLILKERDDRNFAIVNDMGGREMALAVLKQSLQSLREPIEGEIDLGLEPPVAVRPPIRVNTDLPVAEPPKKTKKLAYE